MGTPDLAATCLENLLRRADFQIIAAVTQPDRPRGRNLQLHPSPVKTIALRAGLPVLQPERARDEAFIQQLRSLSPDLITVAAFGQILPRAILELPPHACLNVHTSLLPKYRGAAPIQWAILNDESITGVTIMKMDAGLDTGDILSREQTPIQPDDDSQTLHDRLATMGGNLLSRKIPDWVSGKIAPQPQPADGVSHAPKIRKEDGRIDWTQPARTLWNRIRAFTPWPGAFTYLPGDAQPQILKLWEAAPVAESGPPGVVMRRDKNGITVGCGDGALLIRSLQKQASRRMTAGEFLAGHELKPGTKLG